MSSLGASSPLCYKQLGRGWGTSKHNCLVSYLLVHNIKWKTIQCMIIV